MKNNGSYCDTTKIVVVFYKYGKPCDGSHSEWADVDNPGDADYLEFDFPYDSEYNTIIPDSDKIFVNYSYLY